MSRPSERPGFPVLMGGIALLYFVSATYLSGDPRPGAFVVAALNATLGVLITLSIFTHTMREERRNG